MALPVTDQLITQMMTENVRTQPTVPMEGNVSRPMIVGDLLKAMKDVNFSQLMNEYGNMAGQAKPETKPLTTGLMQQEGPKVPDTPLEEAQPTRQQTAPVDQPQQEEIQEESQQEAFLEPVPYKRKVTKEEAEDTATVSQDTSSEEEATPKEERPVNAEEKVFKKRYDDLKRHYDSTVNKHKDDVEKLKRQLEENADKINLPKTKEEVDAWKAKYPDVYDIIETIAYTKADEKSKKLQSDLKELETQQASVQRDKAEVELAKLHPDFNDIREDEKFHEWVAKQDSTIQGWLYDNTSNAKLAARAIDLYKMDTGYGKKKTNKSLEASKSVTSTSKREVDTSNKKMWKISEIAKMKPQQFAKYEKDIDLARKEGRIVNG